MIATHLVHSVRANPIPDRVRIKATKSDRVPTQDVRPVGKTTQLRSFRGSDSTQNSCPSISTPAPSEKPSQSIKKYTTPKVSHIRRAKTGGRGSPKFSSMGGRAKNAVGIDCI